MKSCTFYGLGLTNPKDFNLVAGSDEFRPIDAILQLPFAITNHSPYVCRKCKGNLKSYIQAKEKFHTIEEQLRETYFKCGFVDCANSHEKCEPKIESKEIQTNLSFDIRWTFHNPVGALKNIFLPSTKAFINLI